MWHGYAKIELALQPVGREKVQDHSNGSKIRWRQFHTDGADHDISGDDGSISGYRGRAC